MTSEKDISSAMLGAGVSTMGGGSAFPPALSTAVAGSEPRKIEDVLASEGFYMGPPAGVSMWPMLRNRHDVMMVVPAEGELRRYDVALYRRGEKYVLHRVVGHYGSGSEKGYVICGDNCVMLEYVRVRTCLACCAASIATAVILIAKPPAATMRIRSCGWRCSPCARCARAQMLR